MDKMTNNYKKVLAGLIQNFTGLDFQAAASAAGCRYNSEKHHIILDYFGEEHTVDCITGNILPHKETTDRASEKITIINYFNRYPMYKDARLTGNLVPLKLLPNGGALFDPAFKRMAIDPLSSALGANPRQLYQAMAPLKARKAWMGDAAITFNALPLLPITVVLWQGDDEIPPSATILFDSSASLFAHIEDIIGLGIIAANRILTYCPN